MVREPRRSILVVLLVVVLGACAVVGSAFFGRVGPQPDGTGVTPNHWLLTPAGLQVEIGDRPLGIATTPDGRYLLISNNGQGEQSLVLFDTTTQEVVQTIPYSSPEALFLGIAVTPDGRRVYASAGGNNKIRVYDLTGRTMAERPPISLGTATARIYPAGLAISPDGAVLYAALNLENAVVFIDTAAGQVRARVRLAPPARADNIGTLPYALVQAGEKLYVSEWNGGGVSVIDIGQQRLLQRIPTGGHASGLALSPDRKRLYVANATSDTVSVVDTSTDAVVGTVDLSPYSGAPMGSMPNALAVAPDGHTLYVANMKGLGAGPNPRGPNPERPTPTAQYIGSMARGTLSVIAVPNAAALRTYTTQVVKNNGFDETQKILTQGPRDTTPHAVPRRVGDPSLIRHVMYIIKENRTYDQVLGDVPQGDGDRNLVLFGRDITPNHHALAETFVLLDNCYADAEVSADGHNWSTAAVATDYVQKMWPANYSNRNRAYDFQGGSSASAPLRGYLWEYAARAGLTYRVYGEFFAFRSKPPAVEPAPFANALTGHFSPTYAGYDLSIRDQARVDAWEAEFEEFVRRGTVPTLMILSLPNDHTAATRPGYPTPKAMVADNDLALGRIVQTVSRSPIWRETAIFIIEDDAQDGPDHVDAHRTVCLVASPYGRRGVVDHGMYSTVSMLRTIELILGLPPMSQFDAAAAPMMTAFSDTPTLTPYDVLQPKQALGEVNQKNAYRAKDSKDLALDRPDEADARILNAILWHAVKGTHVPMPRPKTAFRSHPLQDN